MRKTTTYSVRIPGLALTTTVLAVYFFGDGLHYHDADEIWFAAGLVAAGFAGVRYYARHDPSQRSLAVALFGLAGEATWPVASTEPISPELTNQVRRRFGIHVLPTP